MALKTRADGLGAGPDDETAIASDVPAQPGLPAVRPSDEVTTPVVVRNTLWQAADPAAYDGGRPTDITHLAEFAAGEAGRRDDARWSGVLEVIPTKADYVLDLIRRDLGLPSRREWFERLATREPVEGGDIAAELRTARAERDAQIDTALAGLEVDVNDAGRR